MLAAALKPHKECFMKKTVILIILIMLVVSMGFAQEKASNVKDNWISGELTIAGAGIRYERMLSSAFSIGAIAYYSDTFILLKDIGVDAFARWYPWGKTFYLGLGIGFHMVSIAQFGDSDTSTLTGAAITPELGWKIDVGAPGGFFIQPGVKIPITFGVWDYSNEFDTNLFPIVYFGIGFSF